MSALRRITFVVVTSAGLVPVGASPAAAHGLGGPQPTNYRTELVGIRPPVPGLSVRALEFGDRLEVTNRGTRPVVVLGYEGEPYLRITRRGVWENRRSPAVFLNRSAIPGRAAPATFDAAAAPEWRRVAGGGTYRWHDHRAHWMDTRPPPAVRADPGRTHTVIDGFRVPLVVDGTQAAIVGDVRWVPGPSPWRALVAAGALAGLVTLVGRTRAWPKVLVAALLVAVTAEVAHVVGAWRFSTAAVPDRISANLYSMVGIGIALVAARGFLRRDPWAAVPAGLVAGIFVLLTGGLAGITALSRSQLPTALAAGAARATVVVALGLGAGIVIVAGTRLRLPAAGVATPAAAVGIVLSLGVSLAVPAGAHVTVEPRDVARGGVAIFAFSVPNERDDAGTTGLEIVFPTEHPITTVAVEPVPGWTSTVQRRTGRVGGATREVVDRIVWRGGPIPPGGFQRFWVSAGPMPTGTDRLTFAALQTYADGEVVRWIEPTPPSGAPPAFPAPELRLVAADRSPSVAHERAAGRARDPGSADTPDRTASVLAVTALVVALASLGIVLRARRRPAPHP